MPTGGGMAGYAGTTRAPRRTPPRPNNPSQVQYSPAGNQYGGMVRQGLHYQSQQPGGGSTWWFDPADTEAAAQNPGEFARVASMFAGGTPGSGLSPGLYGGGGRGGGGGGGGGGGAGPGGFDQATLDWLTGMLGSQRPGQLTYNPIDMPDPSQYMRWDPSQFNTARQGITTGLAGVQQRATSAYDQAQGELGRFVNPFTAQGQINNPAASDHMMRMAAQNGALSAVGETAGEGVQADRAFGNARALLAGTEQARQAANLRALAGDRRTTEQNIGLEGNMLNLGVNMAEARGKSAFDQALQQAMFETEMQERMANWQRQNQVGDTNVGNQNTWNQNLMDQYMQIAAGRAPGTTLPALASLFGGAAPAAGAPAAGAPARTQLPGGIPKRGAAPGSIQALLGLLGSGPGGGGMISTNPVIPGMSYNKAA